MRNKGAISNIALSVVIFIVAMFLGIFVISKIATIQPQKEIYDYGYTTTTNDTTGAAQRLITAALNPIVNLTFSILATTSTPITGETDASRLLIYVYNPNNTNIELQISLNNVVLGNITALPSPSHNDTGKEFGATFRSNALNNATLVSVAGSNVTIQNASWRYPTSRTSTGIGSVFTNLTASTGTMYDVLILVGVVVAIGVAIVVLKGVGAGRPKEYIPSGAV